MATLARDGVKLYYEEAGSGDPPMVFVHGWTCNHTYFAPQCDHFKGSHRVVAIDLRGHGASDAPEQDYTIPGFADDVAAVCSDLELRKPVVIGHSMGGAIACDLAARYPDLLSGIVMVDPAPIVVSPETQALLGQLVEGLTSPGAGEVRSGFVANMLFLETDDPALKARVLDEMSSVPDRIAASCFVGMGAWQGEAALKAVQVPVLNISAAQPPNDPESLKAIYPSIVNEQTPTVGHFNQLLAPDEVNGMIERFLKTL